MEEEEYEGIRSYFWKRKMMEERDLVRLKGGDK